MFFIALGGKDLQSLLERIQEAMNEKKFAECAR